jgi:hypothetical protein
LQAVPRVRSITIGVTRKYQHPYIPYENFQIEGSVTVDLDDDETPAEAAEKSFPILREQMIASYKQFKPKKPREGRE